MTPTLAVGPEALPNKYAQQSKVNSHYLWNASAQAQALQDNRHNNS